jgi:O-antigen/teichoic acid export membrane protein
MPVAKTQDCRETCVVAEVRAANGPSSSGPQNRTHAEKFPVITWARVRQVGFSITDQGFSVGGMFLANIALARTQSKAEYGVFVLTYSVFTFLAGLHNAAILEAYTIYGSGRYHQDFASYARLLWRSNGLLAGWLMAIVAAVWGTLTWFSPAHAPRTILGMALACGILLSAAFLRRTFYMQRRPELAAKFSAIFFFLNLVFLLVLMRTGRLDGFSVFVAAALAWSLASISVVRELPGKSAKREFLKIELGYWREHWKYSRWVLVTALVFQFLTQGYYWLAALLLSFKDTGELRALYNVVTPLDQVFGAVTLLVLPILSRRFASERLPGLMALWKTYCLGWLVASGSFAAAVILFGKQFMHLLYAGRFDDVAPRGA